MKTPHGSRIRFRPFTFLIVIVGFVATHAQAEVIKESAIDPNTSDNFYEARTRLWISDQCHHVKGIIVFLGGTDSDGRGFADKFDWQKIAKNSDYALLGCYFRGDGEPYENASKGSGMALLRMLEDLSATTNRPELRSIPLILIGYSSGAMFTYNFACWMSSRVGGIISVKSGPIDVSKASAAYSVPALFIVGEGDETGRRRPILEAIAKRSSVARWALALQPSSGHEWNSITDNFVRAYVAELSQLKLSSSAGVSRSLSCPVATSSTAQMDSMWFPNGKTAVLWETFTKAGSLKELFHACDIEDASPKKSLGRLDKTTHVKTKSPLTANPSGLYLGVLPRNSNVEREINLSWPASFGLRITAIRSSKPDFASAEVVGSASSPSRIRCKFTGRPLGNQSGAFDVVLDDNETKHSRIIFIGWVSK